MRYQTERCLQCGNLGDSPYVIADTGYWFCCLDCLSEAIDEYLPKRFRYKLDEYKNQCDAPPFKEYCRELEEEYKPYPSLMHEAVAKFNAYREQYYAERDVELKKARKALRERGKKEWALELKKRAEDARIKAEKEQVRQTIEEERKKREQERLAEKRQRDEERAKREEERLEEKRLRDEERAKREEERVRKEYEQIGERWLKEQEKIDEERRLEEERIEQLRERDIPYESWFSGCWIVSPHGRGKTTLLIWLIIRNFFVDSATVIIDGKGDLINAILPLEHFAPRYIILDPRNPIAINPLDVSKMNVSEAVNRLEYIFNAILESKITPKQKALFRSVLRALVIGFENPTLELFRDILTNG